MRKLLIIDDDEYFVKTLKRILITLGEYEPQSLTDRRKELLRESFLKQFDAVFLDLYMPKPDGRECLSIIRKIAPSLPVIIVTGENNAETAVEYLKSGAYDYLTKPLDINRLKATLENLFRFLSLEEELSSVTRHLLRNELENPEYFRKIITSDETMLNNFRYIEAIAKTSRPVLVCGETGTGKEMIAEALHKCSGRKGQYVTLDASGVDDSVFSDTLFGHVKGAFTGADKNRSGLIESAADGTIFLDEISDLQEASQIKLLRLLQTGEYYPLGSDAPKISRARIVAAANRPLSELAGKGFRNDLYYRLSAFKIELPPLRERKGDIPILASFFYSEAAGELGIKDRADETIFGALLDYAFPGNIRELKSIVENTALKQKLGYSPKETLAAAAGTEISTHRLSLKDIFGRFPTLQETSDRLIEEAMQEAGGRQKEAAQLLGLSRQAFNRRLNLMKKK